MSFVNEVVMSATSKVPPSAATIPLAPASANNSANALSQHNGIIEVPIAAAAAAAVLDPSSSAAAADAATVLQISQEQLPAPHEMDAATAAALRGATEAVSRKKPLMTHGKDGTLLSPKKLRRLEKNRLSARECRRRKREATENLQHQINALEAENMQLRLQLRIGQEAESNIAHEQSQASQEIQALLQSGASEADIYVELEKYQEQYADYGTSRRSSIQFHLEHIENLLMPTQTTSIIMHAIQGGDSGGAAVTTSDTPTADPPAAAPPTAPPAIATTPHPPPAATDGPRDLSQPKALFQHLVEYLEVTPEQASALKDSRLVAREMDGCLESALGVLAELRQRLEQTGNDLETEFDQVRAILTPTQAAKFLVWVANNDACMHLLNELWDRVYSIDGRSGEDGEDSTSNPSSPSTT